MKEFFRDDVNHQNDNVETALIEASKKGHNKIVNILTDNGYKF